MSGPGAWRPLLAGELAEQAWAAIRDIARELPAAELVPRELPRLPGRDAEEEAAAEPVAVRSASLSGGKTGLAMFYAYLAEAGGEDAEAAADRAAAYLDEAVELLASEPMGPGLYSGFLGVGWAMEHLQGRLYASGEEDSDPNAEIDEALLTLLERPWTETYDLIGGLVGFAVYALERSHRPSAARCLERLVEQLAELSEARDGGEVTWFTPPRLLPEHQRVVSPGGYYNLGVAHGVPGALPILAGACRAGIAVERAAPLLKGAVHWLLAQEMDAGERGSHFAYSIPAPVPGEEGGEAEKESPPPARSRLAWCYGDLGLAVALLWTARLAGRDDWEQAALRIALDATRRDPATAGVLDAGLCHGAAGVAHLFNRLYQATRDERFADAARDWFTRTLALRAPGEPVAGFRAWRAWPDPDQPLWAPEPGLLEGAAGIGLALLAAVSPVAPDWDRMLAVTVPALSGDR